MKTEKERQLVDWSSVEGGSGGVNSYEFKKAWSSIDIQYSMVKGALIPTLTKANAESCVE
jgi:hypothetical protein